MAKKPVSIHVEGEGLVFTIPSGADDKAMNFSESYLAACFAIWVAAEGQDDRAKTCRAMITALAATIVNEDMGPSEGVH